MRRHAGSFVLVAGILGMTVPAWGSHLDREIEAVNRAIEETMLTTQRAQTLTVMGTGEHRGAIAAGQDDLAQLHKRLKELEEQARKDHAAQKK